MSFVQLAQSPITLYWRSYKENPQWLRLAPGKLAIWSERLLLNPNMEDGS